MHLFHIQPQHIFLSVNICVSKDLLQNNIRTISITFIKAISWASKEISRHSYQSLIISTKVTNFMIWNFYQGTLTASGVFY